MGFGSPNEAHRIYLWRITDVKKNHTRAMEVGTRLPRYVILTKVWQIWLCGYNRTQTCNISHEKVSCLPDKNTSWNLESKFSNNFGIFTGTIISFIQTSVCPGQCLWYLVLIKAHHNNYYNSFSDYLKTPLFIYLFHLFIYFYFNEGMWFKNINLIYLVARCDWRIPNRLSVGRLQF